MFLFGFRAHLCKAAYHYADHYSVGTEFVLDDNMISLNLKLCHDFYHLLSFFKNPLPFLEEMSLLGQEKYGKSILNIEWQWETPEEKNFHHKVFSSHGVFEVGHWPAHTKFLLLCFFLN